MKVLQAAFVVFVLFLFSLSVFISLTGLVPGLCEVIGAGTPQDLGVRYSEADASHAKELSRLVVVPMQPASAAVESVRYEGAQDASYELTGEEVTALINTNFWQYQPVSDVQIHLNEDGIAEASGILHINRLLPYIMMTREPHPFISLLDTYRYNAAPAFYIRGTVSIMENSVRLSLQRVEIGFVPIPNEQIDAYIPHIEKFIEERILAVPNLYVRSFEHSAGRIRFAGTIPQTEYQSQ